jgi:hypothetical protein
MSLTSISCYVINCRGFHTAYIIQCRVADDFGRISVATYFELQSQFPSSGMEERGKIPLDFLLTTESETIGSLEY